jgi:uncharacterized integral membrane protein (TIGR00698 family)
VTSDKPPAGRSPANSLIDLAPGIALSAAVAVAAYLAAPFVARVVPIPAMVVALIIGIAVNPFVTSGMRPGMAFCVRTVLRWAVALLGLRVALSDIAALGVATGVMIVVAMTVTLLSGFVFARMSGRQAGFGALVGSATAVCGASAALATSTVVPDYPGKDADTAFVVIAVNALATLGMLIYPPLCFLLGFDAQTTGVMLGGTIHDVAQVVGAGYGVSEAVGNTAVIVKLFRVFLLLPVVLGVGWYFTRQGSKTGAKSLAGGARVPVPVPVFALVFLALCLVNSALPLLPALAPVVMPVKAVLIEASTWGLLIAIGALGLDTSIAKIVALGWRHVTTVVASTAVIFVLVTGSLLLGRLL